MKKIISVVLCTVLLCGMLAVSAFSGAVNGEVFWGYDETSLAFYLAAEESSVSGCDIFGSIDTALPFDSANAVPWHDYAYYAKSVSVLDGIAPLSTAFWFIGFENADSFDIEKLDTGKSSTMAYMFSSCGSAESIDVSSFDTSSCTSLRNMFNYCVKLKEIDISGFETGKVEDMSGLFRYCEALTEYTFPKLDCSSLKDINSIFEGCTGLEYVDVSQLDASNVETFSYMFNQCTSLKKIVGIETLNTANAKSMEYMFNSCKSLEEINISGFDTGKLEKLSSMFESCESLLALDLSFFDCRNDDNFQMPLPTYFRCKLQTVNTPVNYAGSTTFYTGTWADADGNTYTGLPTGLDYSVTLIRTDIPRTVSFDGNGADGEKESVEVKYDGGFDFALPGCEGFTAPEGKSFLGWSESSDGKVISADSISLTSDITLYAIWGEESGDEPADGDVCPYCHTVHKGCISDILCLIYRFFTLVYNLVVMALG